jgi:hypothetical protein
MPHLSEEIVLCQSEIDFKSVATGKRIAVFDSVRAEIAIHEFQMTASEIAEGKML